MEMRLGNKFWGEKRYRPVLGLEKGVSCIGKKERYSHMVGSRMDLGIP